MSSTLTKPPYKAIKELKTLTEVNEDTIRQLALYQFDSGVFTGGLTPFVELSEGQQKMPFKKYLGQLCPRLEQKKIEKEDLEKNLKKIVQVESKAHKTLEEFRENLVPFMNSTDIKLKPQEMEKISTRLEALSVQKIPRDARYGRFFVEVCMKLERVNDKMATLFSNIHQLRSLQQDKLFPVDTVDIWDACRRGPLVAVKFWLSLGGVYLNKSLDPTELKYHPLHWAVLHRQVKIAEYLLENGADVNGQTTVFRQTALHLTAYNDHLEMAKMLVEKGECDVNILDEDDETALHSAVVANSLSVVKYLCETGKVNLAQKNKLGLTAGSLAKDCSKGNEMAQHIRSAEVIAFEKVPIIDYAKCKNSYVNSDIGASNKASGSDIKEIIDESARLDITPLNGSIKGNCSPDANTEEITEGTQEASAEASGSSDAKEITEGTEKASAEASGSSDAKEITEGREEASGSSNVKKIAKGTEKASAEASGSPDAKEMSESTEKASAEASDSSDSKEMSESTEKASAEASGSPDAKEMSEPTEKVSAEASGISDAKEIAKGTQEASAEASSEVKEIAKGTEKFSAEASGDSDANAKGIGEAITDGSAEDDENYIIKWPGIRMRKFHRQCEF